MPQPSKGTIQVPLDHVLDHPMNAHVVSERDRAKITNNIRRTGRYPALVVRSLTDASEYYPGDDGYYQILDGHQRRMIFVELVEEGHEEFSIVRCEDWAPLTDEEAFIALATLNSWGDSAPRKRAELLHRISKFTAANEAAQILPESERQISDAMKLLQQPVSDIKNMLDRIQKPDTVRMTFVVAHDKAALAKFTAAAHIFALYYGATLTNIHQEEGGPQGRTAVLTFEIKNSAKAVVDQALKKAGTHVAPGSRNKQGRSLEELASQYLAMVLTEETAVPIAEMEKTRQGLDGDKPSPAPKKRQSKKATAIEPAIAAS